MSLDTRAPVPANEEIHVPLLRNLQSDLLAHLSPWKAQSQLYEVCHSHLQVCYPYSTFQ